MPRKKKDDALKKMPIAKIKAEYITGEISLRELSKKYEIPEGKLFRHSTKESWQKKREEYRSKLTAEAIASARTRAIDDFNDVIEISKTLAGEIRLALGDPRQLYRRIVSDNEGNLKERDDFTKIDAKAVKDLAGAVEKLANVVARVEKTEDEEGIRIVMDAAAQEYAQ